MTLWPVISMHVAARHDYSDEKDWSVSCLVDSKGGKPWGNGIGWYAYFIVSLVEVKYIESMPGDTDVFLKHHDVTKLAVN